MNQQVYDRITTHNFDFTIFQTKLIFIMFKVIIKVLRGLLLIMFASQIRGLKATFKKMIYFYFPEPCERQQRRSNVERQPEHQLQHERVHPEPFRRLGH